MFFFCILEKEYNNKKSQNVLSDLNKFDDLIENNKLFIEMGQMESNLLKDMAQALLNNKSLDLVFIASKDESKVTFVCASKTVDASLLVKTAAQICNGGGGGRKDLAQAGGKDSSKVEAAIAKVKELC